MISALIKPVTEIKKEDLAQLTQTNWPESENVEFKAELCRNRDGSDPWQVGNLSDQAKNKLFKELVAFANTSGGRLFLGISETGGRPARADAIQPVPRCHELAERLEQSLASSIDPTKGSSDDCAASAGAGRWGLHLSRGCPPAIGPL